MERNKKKLTLPLSSDGVFSPCFSQTQASPMSALSMSMVTLSCMGGTPKKRLSMSSIGEASPLPPSFSRHSSHSSGVSVGTPSPCDSPLILGQFQPINPSNEQSESSRHGAQFRRFNSMPLRLQQQNQNSPSLQTFHRPRLIRQQGMEEPMKEEEDGLWMKKIVGKRKESEEEEETKDRADSLPGHLELASPDSIEEATLPSEGFTFVMPKPLSSRQAPSRASPLSFASAGNRPISAPATLLDGEDDDDAIQLREDRLTSFHDDEDDDADNDDGFSDIFDSDSQEGSASVFSDGLAGLFTGALINKNSSPASHSSALENLHSGSGNIPHHGIDCNTLQTTPSGGPRCRKGNLFKVPSQPLARRNSSFLKRSERPRDTPSPVQNKRPRSSSVASPQINYKEQENKSSPKTRMCLGRSLSMLSPHDPYFKRIDQALSIEGGQNELTGDRTKECCLPTVGGKIKDLKSISPETMCQLLRSEVNQEIGEYHIIDCRYPYEYKGGHIKGAINIYQEDELKKMFLKNPLPPLPNNRRRVIIFHCEFSSKRGPKMLRLLRTEDRSANLENYPTLYYPELYLLNEGYKAFYEYSTEFCEPKAYTPMDHSNHLDDLRHFRAKSKSWSEKSRLKIRSQSLF